MVAVIGTGLAGCAPSQQSFKPAEKVGGETVEGFKEAFYDLALDDRRIGEVKVWSSGASVVKREGREMTLIRLGFTIENKGDVPIELDPANVELESVQTKDGTYENLKPIRRAEPIVVEPRTSRDVELAFALPTKITPDEILAFRAKWTTNANGMQYTEFTPFVQQPKQRYAYVPVHGYYYPYYPFDYPYYGPYWYPHGRVVIVQPYPRRVIVRGHRGQR